MNLTPNAILRQRLSHSVSHPSPNRSAIAAFLDRETASIDSLKLVKRPRIGAIERLQEYRTALITAAVTGKIDVRE